jgi:hypothetical protein
MMWRRKPRQRRPGLRVWIAAGSVALVAAAGAVSRRLRRRRAIHAPLEPMRPHPPEIVARNRVLLRLDLLAAQARAHHSELVAQRLEEVSGRHEHEPDETIVARDASKVLTQLRDDPQTPDDLRELLVLPPDLSGVPASA